MAVQHLRPRPWLLVTAIAAAALFVAGLVLTYRQNGWTWLSLAFAGMTLKPELGYNSQGLTNTVCAWLRRHADRQA